jgi:hypothetical protein
MILTLDTFQSALTAVSEVKVVDCITQFTGCFKAQSGDAIVASVSANDKKNRRIEARETTRDCDFGSLSDRHWLFIYMEIVARQTRRAKLRTQIFISLLAMESMSLVVLWNKRIIPWNKDYLWCIEEAPHRTDSLTLLIA